MRRPLAPTCPASVCGRDAMVRCRRLPPLTVARLRAAPIRRRTFMHWENSSPLLRTMRSLPTRILRAIRGVLGPAARHATCLCAAAKRGPLSVAVPSAVCHAGIFGVRTRCWAGAVLGGVLARRFGRHRLDASGPCSCAAAALEHTPSTPSTRAASRVGVSRRCTRAALLRVAQSAPGKTRGLRRATGQRPRRIGTTGEFPRRKRGRVGGRAARARP